MGLSVQAKTEIAKEVKDTLTKSMATFGFVIIETLVRLRLHFAAISLKSYSVDSCSIRSVARTPVHELEPQQVCAHVVWG